MRPIRVPSLSATLLLASLTAVTAFGAPGALTAQPQGVILAANKTASTLSFIDIATGRELGVVPTGTGPHEVAVAHDGSFAVVADYGAQQPGATLTVVDVPGRRVVRTISLGSYTRPHGITVLPGDSLVAVTSETTGRLVLVHVASGTVRDTIPTNGRASHMVAVRADGRRAFTANIRDGSVSEIDLATRRFVRTMPAATMTEGVGVTPDGTQVWVGSNDQHTVTVLDVARGVAIDTIPAPGFPYRVGMSADGKTAVIPAPEGQVLHVFDVATRERRHSVSLPGQPMGAVVTPDGRWAFVTMFATDEVALVNLVDGTEVRRYPVGDGPDGIGVALRR